MSKGKNKRQFPSKSQISKQAAAHKPVDNAKASAAVKPGMQSSTKSLPLRIHVNIPKAPTKPATNRTAASHNDVFSVQALTRPVDVEEPSADVTVRLPENTPAKPFPFLQLPRELQDEVYGYLFDHPLTFHIKFFGGKGKGKRALTYSLPNQKSWCQPRIDKTAIARRRELDFWTRRNSEDKYLPVQKLPTGFLQLFHVHPRIAERAAPYFYRLHTFRFSDIKPLRAFLNALPASSKTQIRNVELIHSTRSWSMLKDFSHWKIRYDHAWMIELEHLADEVTGLRDIKLDLRLRDKPPEIHMFAPWRIHLQPLEDFDHLKEAKVTVKGRPHLDNPLRVEAHNIEHQMLGTECDEDCHENRRSVKDEKPLPKPLHKLPHLTITTADINSAPPSTQKRRSRAVAMRKPNIRGTFSPGYVEEPSKIPGNGMVCVWRD